MEWINRIRDDLDHAERLEKDFDYYAAALLKVRPKAGGLIPFELNKAQLQLHQKLEEQKQRTGMVRAVVLKSRQLGCSTYLAGRLLKLTLSNPGIRTGIIAHQKSASGNLYKIVRRFYDHLPPELKPELGTANAQELIFSRLDSGYSVSVATEEGAGRSDTLQAVHASECAFWPDMSEQLSALMQTVPRLPGTEIILETTANAFGDPLHQFWQKALSGENGFMPVFIPWMADDGYRETPPPDFKATPEERAVAEAHGLDDAQLYWRRMKIAELGDEKLFRREYPADAHECFISSDHDSFIRPELVMQARKEEIEPYGDLIIGIDPAAQGADSTGIAWRRGFTIEKLERRRGLDTMELVGLITRLIREDKPDRVFIDVGSFGLAIYQRLVELGHSDVVTGVNFGSKPLEPPTVDDSGRQSGGYLNRRSELWSLMKRALEGRFQLPDRDDLMSELTSPGYKFDSQGRLVLEAKADMRRRGLPSPDLADAVALTFGEPGGDAFVRANNFWRKIEYAGGAYA
jgi:hypothetical protein